jgi:RNA 3'-terminal phosphate cyclase
LEEVIKIYEQERFIAMESIVVSALKEDKVGEHQIEKIRRAFNTKEVKKQIDRWLKRNNKE